MCMHIAVLGNVHQGLVTHVALLQPYHMSHFESIVTHNTLGQTPIERESQANCAMQGHTKSLIMIKNHIMTGLDPGRGGGGGGGDDFDNTSVTH